MGGTFSINEEMKSAYKILARKPKEREFYM
jgi:hypothetical protein